MNKDPPLVFRSHQYFSEFLKIFFGIFPALKSVCQNFACLPFRKWLHPYQYQNKGWDIKVWEWSVIMISVQMLMMPTSVIIINTSIIRIPLMMIPNIMMIFFVLTPNPKLFCPQNTVRYLDKYTWKIHSDEYIREIHFDSIFQNVPRSIFWIFWSPLKPEKMCRFYTCLHTSKKAEFLETLSPQIFWIFRKILNWERKITTAHKPSPK